MTWTQSRWQWQIKARFSGACDCLQPGEASEGSRVEAGGGGGCRREECHHDLRQVTTACKAQASSVWHHDFHHIHPQHPFRCVLLSNTTRCWRKQLPQNTTHLASPAPKVTYTMPHWTRRRVALKTATVTQTRLPQHYVFRNQTHQNREQSMVFRNTPEQTDPIVKVLIYFAVPFALSHRNGCCVTQFSSPLHPVQWTLCPIQQDDR